MESLLIIFDQSIRHANQQVYDTMVTGTKNMQKLVSDLENIVLDMNERRD